MPNTITSLPKATSANETAHARVSTPSGGRSYAATENAASAPLCDEQGRLIVRTASAAGFITPNATGLGVAQEAGSAPQKDNLGLVISAKVMERATFFDPTTLLGYPFCTRMFGYSASAGFVQLILKDESGGANPPINGDIPEVTIPIGAGQNFAFGEYGLGAAGNNDDATYIALSTTGPTLTLAGTADLWFYFLGAV